ncbi:hypothetical protein Cgig2_030874 [Carnegiea gigantea]|uniref:Uncharacterized protein n=1 Tax=Carnegiea gigantea TaxID=171969 RepID=A0A9Q1KHU2_9CARY|nr:hypothetical protein Cgig2_030874 [Carnegiea gigantea]
MMRKMNSLITTSQSNINARAHCEKYFTELKKLIKFDVGRWPREEFEFATECLNPPSSRQKGVRNKRLKSIVEKKCDHVKRRKSKKIAMNDELYFSSGPSSYGTSYSQMMRQGFVPPLSFHPTYFFHSANNSSVFMPVMAPSVLQQFHTNIINANSSHNDKP